MSKTQPREMSAVLAEAPCIPALPLQSLAILRDELIQIYLRKRALLSLILYFVIIALVIRLFLWIQAKASFGVPHAELYAVLRQRLSEQITNPEILRYLNVLDGLQGLPLALVMLQLFSFFWLPTLVSLLSCDIISLDVSRGTIRFLLLRATRSSYLLGRVLAHTIAGLLIHAVTIGFLYLLSTLLFPSADHSEYLPVSMRYLFVSAPFLFLSVAVASLVSSVTRRALTSLLLIQLVWLGLLLVARIHPLLSPFHPSLLIGFFSPYSPEYHIASGGFLLWGCGFYLLTWLRIKSREM